MSITDVTVDVERAIQDAVGTATTSASTSNGPSGPGLTRRARLARLVGGTALAALLATLPFTMHWAGPAYAIDYGLIVAMTVLSISVLGWIGEISLAPVAQMGFGVVAVNVCQVHDIPFGFTLPLVALSSLPISLLLAAFTLRLKGVSFAIATLAFAYMAHKTFFLEYLGTYGAFGGTGTTQVTRPSFVRTDESLYYLELAVLIVVALLCYAINRSRIGARFTALRESEMAFSTLGHPPAAYRFFAICLSGAIATVAGAMFVYLQLQVPSNLLLPAQAVLFFGYAVAGGLGSVTGALAAGAVFGAIPKYLETLTKSEFLNYDLFVIGLVVFVVMMKAPGGLAEVGRRLWRRVGESGVTAAGRLERRISPAGRERGREVMSAWQRLSDGADAGVVPARPMSVAPWSIDVRDREDGHELLAVEDLSINFGGVQALREVRLTVRTGEVTGVIGPNGAGKSTLFNCLSGLLQPDRGTVTFDGSPLRGAPSVRARRGLGRTFQTPRLFRSLSVLDNLLFGCETADWAAHRYVFDPRLGRVPQRERAERIARFVGFKGDLAAAAGSLPFGDLRTVELARALCGAPQLLMLDEPASGLDADQAATFVGLLRELAGMGLAVLLIEHDMALVMGLCKWITVLDFGQVIAEGTPDEVQRNETVISAYLGRSAAHA